MYGMGNMDWYIFMAIGGVMSLIGMMVGARLQAKAKKYSAIGIRSGITGAEVAARMLKHYGVSGVQILQGEGFLTDHYHPVRKTVVLSPAIYGGRSILSAAVAAHEVGHAVQHAFGYAPVHVRSALVPIVQFSAKIQQYVLLGAFMLFASSPNYSWVMLVAIALFAVTALFSIITLPVEFDATRRGLKYLEESGLTQGEEHEGAKDALWWAAMTYVVAALSALVMVLYLILRYRSGNRA